MRTTVTIDDALYQREAMQLFVRVQAGKRLAALGGTLPDMKDIPRRRASADARR